MHDSRPPSSIIIRSPLELVQSTGDIPVSGKPAIPLATPFVATKAPTALESIPNPCCKQSHTTVKPTSPIMAPTKTHTETVIAVCEIPHIRDIAIPEEIDHLTGLRIEDDDGISERSVLHRAHSQEGVRDATNTPKSNYHSYVASDTMYSPSSRNVGLYLADTPSRKDVSPPAIFSGVGGVDSAQFAAFPRASNTPDHSASGSELVPSSTASPSTPSTTAESHEIDESERSQMWTKFKPLIHLLLAARAEGVARPTRSITAVALVQLDKLVYQRAGVSKFREYTALAEQAGIIELGGLMGDAWIALHPNWFGADGITTTHLHSNRVSSPTSDPPRANQDPLSTGSNTPPIPIERIAISPTPTSASPKCRSLESSNALPNLPSDRQGSALRACIPAQFQPLIDILTQLRAEGSHQTLRSIIGQSLGRDVYAQAGVLGFKEYIHQASEVELVQCGGVGGHAWIRLHPELRV